MTHLFSQCLDTYLFLSRFLPIYIHANKFHQYLNQFLQHVLLALYTEGHYVGPLSESDRSEFFLKFCLVFGHLTFFTINFEKNSTFVYFTKTINVSNSLNSFCRICFESKLFAKVISSHH